MQAIFDFAFSDPISRHGHTKRILFFGIGEIPYVVAVVGGPAVVELMDQLGLIQGQKRLPVNALIAIDFAHEAIAGQLITGLFQLVACAKQMRVV